MTTEEEVLEWARRMIDDIEDFDYLETAEEWEDYLEDINAQPGFYQGFLSDAPAKHARQIEALHRGRELMRDFVDETRIELGFEFETTKKGQTVIRDFNTGQFTSMKAVKETIINLREYYAQEAKYQRQHKREGR